MNWIEAAEAAPSIAAKDIVHLTTSAEETDQLIALYARSLANARSDSADIAMIALKKALSEHPAWGEAALLYGICLALDGKLKRAKASFEHAMSVGLVSEQTTYLAQICYQLAVSQTENPAEQPKQEENLSMAMFFRGRNSSKRKKSIYEEPNTEEKGRMTAPILTKAPKSAAKARMASDRERRDVLMQANSSNPEGSDEEIEVSIPKTPAEKLRIFLSLLGIILISALLGLFVWYIAIPGVNLFMKTKDDSAKLSFLMTEMAKVQEDPAIKKVLDAYTSKYPNPDSLEETKPSVTGQSSTEAAPTAGETVPSSTQETTIPQVSDETTTDLTTPENSVEPTTPGPETTSANT